MTVFGDRASKEVNKFITQALIQSGHKKRHQENMPTEERPCEDIARRHPLQAKDREALEETKPANNFILDI